MLAASTTAETAAGSGSRDRSWPEPVAMSLWAAAVLVAAMALPAANWTDDLGLVPMTALLGLGLAALLVASRFRAATASLLGAAYGAVTVLLQVVATLDRSVAWRERVADLGRRLAIFGDTLLRGDRSYDSLMFVLAMALLAWATAVFGTWWLFRRNGLWPALLLPGLTVFLNVYYYRFGTRLQIYLPVFLLILLALVARLELLGRRRSWNAGRAQVPTDIAGRISRAGAMVAAVLVGLAWLLPSFPETRVEAAGSGGRSAIGDWFSDAFAGLRSPVNLYGEAFADSLSLGPGRDPGTRAVFQAALLGEIPAGSRPYWRARVFDTYQDGQWSGSVGEEAAYRPGRPSDQETVGPGRFQVEFLISPFVPAMRLLYLPSEVMWFNRSADVRQVVQQGEVVEVLEGVSAQILVPGDTYRVRSALAAPRAGDLRRAGDSYPEWIRTAYLQLPDDLPEAIPSLAAEITRGAATPYDKAVAVTAWLRSTIEYRRVTQAPPPDRDPVEWFLTDSRIGFCDYYTSAMVLMLRAVGVPSRMAAGYAAGAFDPEQNRYFVSAVESHSWPEVFFPGFGWVEFEPTASQPPLERLEGGGDGLSGAGASGDPAESDSGAAGAGGAAGLSGLDRLEEIELPEATAPGFPWVLLGLSAAVLLTALLSLRPVRSTVGRAGVRIARGLGRPAPGLLADWATPVSESASAFARMIRWSKRLGLQSGAASTARERALTLAAEIPAAEPLVLEMLRLYSDERYGDRPGRAGAPTRAWRSLRPALYRRWIGKTVGSLFGASADPE